MSEGWFVPTETYRRPLRNPVTDEEGWVELRVLDSGVKAQLEDKVRIEAAMNASTGVEEMNPQLLLGTMKMLTVQAAVVRWSLPQAPTNATLSQLNPDVTDQIFEYASFGVIPPDPEVPELGEEEGGRILREAAAEDQTSPLDGSGGQVPTPAESLPVAVS